MSIIRNISQYKVIKIGRHTTHTDHVHNKTVHYDNRLIKKEENFWCPKHCPVDFRISIDNDRMIAPTQVAWDCVVAGEFSTTNLEKFLQEFLYVTFVINIQFISVIHFLLGNLHSDALRNHYKVSSYRLRNNMQESCPRFAGNFRFGGSNTLCVLALVKFLNCHWISYAELSHFASLIYNSRLSVAVEYRIKLVEDSVSQDLLLKTLFDEIKNQHARYDVARVDIDAAESRTRLFGPDYDKNNKHINDLYYTYVFCLVFRIFLQYVLFAVFVLLQTMASVPQRKGEFRITNTISTILKWW